MRSTVEIICAVKDGEPVTEQELRLALLVMSHVDYFLTSNLRRLCGQIDKYSVSRRRRGTPPGWGCGRLLDDMFAIRKADPSTALGPSNTPGSPEHDERMRAGKALVKRATGVDLDAPASPEARAQPCALVLDAEERLAVLAAAAMYEDESTSLEHGPALHRVVQRLSPGGES